MREWTREERYRVLQSAEEIRELHERIRESCYRQKYHVQPVTGLSSDPNGFVSSDGTWHLYYQWCPWGAVHGLKYWYHVTSPDLVHWKNEGTGLKPDRDYDNKGNHSGSAISENGELYMFYTGNHRDENWVRTPYTCAAKLDENGELQKLDKPLFGPRDDYSEHQRDPKVFYVPEKAMYYIFIGAQTLDERGTVLVYTSRELLSGWTFAGPLKVTGYEKFGGMWECPSFENISGKDVLIFSPQYTKLPGRAESTNHNIYLLGQMDFDTLTFTPETEYTYLDYGFDFYAAQLAANVEDPDKAVMIGWIGLPDNHYATEPEDWEGSMTLPRELRLKEGRIYQTPVPEIRNLRGREMAPDGRLPKAAELEISFGEGDADVNLYTKDNGTGGLKIHYDAASNTCTIDKRGMNERFNEHVGEVLDMPLASPLKNMTVFIDSSSTEIFVNDGEETFTAHTYPTVGEHHYTVSDSVSVRIWPMNASVKDDFVV